MHSELHCAPGVYKTLPTNKAAKIDHRRLNINYPISYYTAG